MITDEQKKDIDTAVETIIHQCRSHHGRFARAIAHEQLTGLLLCLRFVERVDCFMMHSRETVSYIEDDYRKKIDEEIE